MKRFLLSFLLASCSTGLLAGEQSYDALLDSYYRKDLSEIPAHANGPIDGVEYIVLVAESPSEGGPVILLFQKADKKAALVRKIDLQGDHSAIYDVAIKNNALYLESVVGHHGWHGARYQFKQVDGKFRMIGIESRSEALGCYAGDESPTCDEYEAWSGTSFNLLTASAVCWRVAFRDERKLEKALARRKEYWQRPKGAVSHHMPLRRAELPLLEEFNILDFSPPHACYLDHKNRVYIERPAP